MTRIPMQFLLIVLDPVAKTTASLIPKREKKSINCKVAITLVSLSHFNGYLNAAN
jgi:hypothetical protein